MLSLTRGILIAKTKEGQSIFLNPNEIKTDGDAVNLLPESFWKDVPEEKKEKLKISIIKQSAPRDASLVLLYDKALNIIRKKTGKEIFFNEGTVYQVPRKDQEIEHILISAPSGAGKTYWACKWIKEFLKMYKNKEFFVISKHETIKDKQVETLNPYRIEIKEFATPEPMLIEGLAGSVVLFDDIESIQNRNISARICQFRNDVVENGRKSDIKILSCIHVLLSGKQNQVIINEATYIVLFPRSGTSGHIRQFCKRYLEFPKDIIKKILDLPSRWVSISKRSPFHVIHEHGAFMV